jgi:hypothetical protein
MSDLAKVHIDRFFDVAKSTGYAIADCYSKPGLVYSHCAQVCDLQETFDRLIAKCDVSLRESGEFPIDVIRDAGLPVTCTGAELAESLGRASCDELVTGLYTTSDGKNYRRVIIQLRALLLTIGDLQLIEGRHYETASLLSRLKEFVEAQFADLKERVKAFDEKEGVNITPAPEPAAV